MTHRKGCPRVGGGTESNRPLVTVTNASEEEVMSISEPGDCGEATEATEAIERQMIRRPLVNDLRRAFGEDAVGDESVLDHKQWFCPANCDCGECYHNPERNCHCFADDTPNPTEPALTDDELIAVRRLLQEQHEDPEARERALYEELFLPGKASRPARSQWSDLADRMVNHLPSAAGEFDADLARLAAMKTAHDMGASRRIRVDINLDPPDKIAEMELEIAVSKFLGREYGFDKVLLLTSERVADEEWRQ